MNGSTQNPNVDNTCAQKTPQNDVKETPSSSGSAPQTKVLLATIAPNATLPQLPIPVTQPVKEMGKKEEILPVSQTKLAKEPQEKTD